MGSRGFAISAFLTFILMCLFSGAVFAVKVADKTDSYTGLRKSEMQSAGEEKIPEKPVVQLADTEVAAAADYGIEEMKFSHIIDFAGNKLSVDCRNIDLMDLFSAIGKKADLNILLEKSVRGKVTVRIRDMAVEEALCLIARINGYDARVNGRTVLIATARKLMGSFDEFSARFFGLENIPARDALDTLKGIFGSKLDIVALKSDSAFIVKGPLPLLDSIQNIVEEMDVAIPFHELTFDIVVAIEGQGDESHFRSTLKCVDGAWAGQKLLFRGRDGMSLSFKIKAITHSFGGSMRIRCDGEIEVKGKNPGKEGTGPVMSSDSFESDLLALPGQSIEVGRSIMKIGSGSKNSSAEVSDTALKLIISVRPETIIH
ncbi:MAG: hypothetical protein CVV64_12855 [Candidatus Wallbacteria bacterium HGW-Wallbacteria-1]|jgi:hypothetical protein|uniref:Secretin/TonB short N-terminal domain-containing protein n=1 Tax=Candidatus Wallbacteria bacterium HGW-Wallbacteria-1 TaxID=2013854 RepID=A0A2N1PMX3_9BACT|nr:MAG: hypothetical protein CVV64_12855 [Candidatus Wallbacteria bacterium HGW-Wallbacteria-1]